MRSKSVLLLTLALGCGLVASIGISQVMDKHNSEQKELGETEPVLVAMTDIGFNEKLSASNIKVEAWPKGKVPTGVATKLEEIEHKRTRMKIFSGEPILQAKLLSPGDPSGVAPEIPKGYRVVSVSVNAVAGTAGLIEPGNRVDVIVYLTKNPSLGIEKTTTKAILQDIAVFAVDTITVTKRQNDKDEQPTTAKTVSLLVTPEQAQKITLASELGQIRLVLRGVGDSASVADSGADVEQLLNNTATGKGDKKAEEELSDKPRSAQASKAAPSAGSGLLAVIAEAVKKAPQLKSRMAPPPPQPWKMVVMKGPEISLVEFASEDSLPLNLPGSAAPSDKPAAAADEADEPAPEQTTHRRPPVPPTLRASRPAEAPGPVKPVSATQPAPKRAGGDEPPEATTEPVPWDADAAAKAAADKQVTEAVKKLLSE